MRATLAFLFLLAACGPSDSTPEEPMNAPETVPPPSAVPGAPRIPAEEAPPAATTVPPER